jgi:hypothetical protein
MVLFLLNIFLSLTTDYLSNSLPQCIGNTKITKSKQQPLKMILSKSVGSHYQMDLIKMPPVQGFRYILRNVDHLSQYGFVAPLHFQNQEEVGAELLKILCQAIIPDILQSDNGSKVSVRFSLICEMHINTSPLSSFFSVFYS